MIENRVVVSDVEIAERSNAAKHLKVVGNVASIENGPAENRYTKNGFARTGSDENNLLVMPTSVQAKRSERPEQIDPPSGLAPSVSAPIDLPKQPRLPFGLRLLHRVQQGSTVLTGLLVTGALVVYGSSVYLDRSTNQAMVQLNALQSESQQLTTANESIKQSLAEQAVQEDSGLAPYQPGDMLFVKPEPRRTVSAEAEENQTQRLQPLGY